MDIRLNGKIEGTCKKYVASVEFKTMQIFKANIIIWNINTIFTGIVLLHDRVPKKKWRLIKIVNGTLY